MSIIVNLSTFPKSSGIYMFKVNDEIVYSKVARKMPLL